MLKKTFIKTLPLVPYAGTFGVFSACGCGQCPACLGASASMVGLTLLIGSKKLISSIRRKGEGEGDGSVNNERR